MPTLSTSHDPVIPGLAAVVLALGLSLASYAAEIIGRLGSVAEGDTIIVLDIVAPYNK